MSQGLVILVFVIAVFLTGILTRFVLRNTPIPYSVALLVIGLIIGSLATHGVLGPADSELVHSILMVEHLDPQLILFLFLPALVFESAYAMESHLFLRMMGQVLLLAIPGLILAILLTAVLTHFALPWGWSWPVAMMFGALISATDPVAVVALLKEMSGRKRLETLIEGESLMNDGTAIVFFTLFYGLVVQGGEASLDWLHMGKEFVLVVSLGAVVGGVLGGIALLWLNSVFNDANIEIGITLVSAYASFYIAEHLLHVSGVVAVVILALILASVGRTRFSPEVMPSLHHFWGMVSYLLNTLIFMIVGMIIGERVRLNDPLYWLALAGLYLGLQLIRTVAIVTLIPLLKRVGIGIDWRKTTVLVWGGLRGAVALSLALVIAQDPGVAPELSEQILFLTAGIVVLSMVINGTSMRWLLVRLGLDKLPLAKQAAMDRARVMVSQPVAELQSTLEQCDFFTRADWKKVDSRLALERATTTTVDLDEKDLNMALRRQLLEAEREYYWQQFRRGVLTRSVVNCLVETVEHALDGAARIGPRPQLAEYWQGSAWMQIGTSRVQKVMEERARDEQELIYGTARAFVEGQRLLYRLSETLSPNPDVEAGIKHEIEINIAQGETQVEALLLAHGDIVSDIETDIATRLLLNCERDVINSLDESGVLDKAEASKLIQEIEQTMDELRHHEAD